MPKDTLNEVFLSSYLLDTTLVRTDRHRDLRALVSSLFPELARSGRTHGRAFAEQRRSAAHHHFTLSGWSTADATLPDLVWAIVLVLAGFVAFLL